jgi:hypothetical protein
MKKIIFTLFSILIISTSFAQRVDFQEILRLIGNGFKGLNKIFKMQLYIVFLVKILH